MVMIYALDESTFKLLTLVKNHCNLTILIALCDLAFRSICVRNAFFISVL